MDTILAGNCLRESLDELYPEISDRVIAFELNKYRAIINNKSIVNPISCAKREYTMNGGLIEKNR